MTGSEGRDMQTYKRRQPRKRGLGEF